MLSGQILDAAQMVEHCLFIRDLGLNQELDRYYPYHFLELLVLIIPAPSSQRTSPHHIWF